MKILIVEDEKEVASELESFLRNKGFSNIGQAGDGIQGVRMAHRTRPDLILLDIGLPGGDGVTTFQRLKLSVLTGKIPVVVLTGINDIELKTKSRNRIIMTLL